LCWQGGEIEMNKALIAEKLVQLRGEKSREEVALSVGISVSALQMYENGQRVPRDEIKIKLANYYNVTVQALFFENKSHETCD
jgi:putative transcriptional regulator